ncbi:hypothetical protein O6P43_016508 [Quillaja saponaria]|uniref:Uncharacterized protein n=1 Tax=Quillaja saponaria TaxID=32244 RepID=A0AAD7PNI0_QUISA|nr:hypothetical protein O6P43_016508 [Quillaja saponaria]
MSRFMAILSSVILRKCTHMYHEYAILLWDLVSILVSSIRFSGLVFRETTSLSPAMYSPMSSLLGRHDR